MKKIIIFLIVITSFHSAKTQSRKPETIFYKEIEISTSNDVKLIARNPIAREDFSKFELRIKNNGKYFVYFKPSECVFKYESGEYRPKTEKAVFVQPDDERSPTLKVTGSADFRSNQFEFIPQGFYIFNEDSTVAEAPDFRLPPNKNDIKFGNFKVQLLKLKKETAQTAVQFEVKYTGDKIAIVSPSKAVVRTEDGTEWANARSHEKPDILEKNETCRFTLYFHIPGKIVDMQFAVMDIVWKSTFTESDLRPIEFKSNTMLVDEEKTAAKNK